MEKLRPTKCVKLKDEELLYPLTSPRERNRNSQERNSQKGTLEKNRITSGKQRSSSEKRKKHQQTSSGSRRVEPELEIQRWSSSSSSRASKNVKKRILRSKYAKVLENPQKSSKKRREKVTKLLNETTLRQTSIDQKRQGRMIRAHQGALGQMELAKLINSSNPLSEKDIRKPILKQSGADFRLNERGFIH